MDNYTILIVDDEPAQREVLSGYLRNKKYTVKEASSAAEALNVIRNKPIDIVLTDYKMSGMSGLELLPEVLQINPETTVVLMTAFGTIENAVNAMKMGAFDYLTKPINLDELDLLLLKIASQKNLISENKLLREKLEEQSGFPSFTTNSQRMKESLSIAVRAAKSKAVVLIQGESGTGKEVLAKAIHFSSPRSNKPFVAVNCAALNENLIESELFGHEKGSFTGAEKFRQGRFELANKGTIFLDEIGDLPLSTQIKLLRVLQEEQIERVGSADTITVDVRVIAATNKDLHKLIKEEKFREDLYYRLNVISIILPPLRERREDIFLLIRQFLTKFSEQTGKKDLSLSKEALDKLLKYSYPGNVRELENIIQRAVVLSRGNIITANEIFLEEELNDKFNLESEINLDEIVERLEKKYIFSALEKTKGNKTQAAKLLGMTERNLRYRLNKWGDTNGD